MKTSYLIAFAFLLLSYGRVCQAQNYFINTYGIDANPCLSIVCTDSCFFSTAQNTLTNMLAMKSDPAGNILWSKQIGLPNAPYLFIKDIAQAADGGFGQGRA